MKKYVYYYRFTEHTPIDNLEEFIKGTEEYFRVTEILDPDDKFAMVLVHTGDTRLELVE